MKNMTLLIMAAGMGSRFGGLKQIEPVGPNDEFIIDYSVYDAVKAGFNKVVFIIKEEIYEEFKNTIGKRVEKHIPVEYVFQKLDDLPDGYSVPEGRTKPWGTGHAILAAKNNIKEDFIIINADDFYGRDAFFVASEFIKNKKRTEKEEYAVVGYSVINTLTEFGSVKRGVCINNGNLLDKLVESSIEEVDGKIVCDPLDDREQFTVLKSHPVSMNMFCFDQSIFKYLEERFITFLDMNKDNNLKCEYLIPEVVSDLIKEDIARVSLLTTTARWQGVTYKEDKPKVVEEINKLIEDGEYPKKLWN